MTSSLYNIYHGSLSITHQGPDPPHHSSYLSTFSNWKWQVKFLHANFPLNLNTPSHLLGKILSFFFFYFFFSSWSKKGMIPFLLRFLFHRNIFSPLKTKDLFQCHLKGDHTIKALLKAQSPVYLLWNLT